MQAPSFSTLDALAIDYAGGGRDLAPGLLTALDVECVVDPIQRAVAAPLAEIAVHRAARWQLLRDVAPLVTGAQHIHQAVHHLAHDHRALAAAALGRWDQWLDRLPLGVSEITRIAQP